MTNLLSALTDSLTDSALDSLTRKLGTNKNQTESLIGTIAPMLLTGMKRNAQDSNGVTGLAAALDKKHDGSILDNITGFLDNDDGADGMGILSHVLGDRLKPTEKNVAAVAGVDEGTAQKAMSMLAPLIMGALGKEKKKSGLDVSGLASLLGGQDAGDQNLLERLIDQDNDGSIMDDLAGMAFKMFKK